MSETISKDGINIEINNSDSNQGGEGGGFLDRIFNLGLRLLVPLLLVFAVFSIIVFFGVVLPLLEDIIGAVSFGFEVASPFGFSTAGIIAAGGGFLAALFGRR